MTLIEQVEKMEDLTVKEVAQKLRVTRRTVLRWAQSDNGPFPNAYQQNPYLETSPWFIPVSDLETFLQMRHGRQAK